MTHILVIEDDSATRDLLRQVLSDEGYVLQLVNRLEESVAHDVPDLVITDLIGLERYDSARARSSVRRVQERFPGTPIVVCTGYQQAAEASDKLGAAAVLPKPFTIEALVEVVARVVAH